MEEEKKHWNENCGRFGFTEDDFGCEFLFETKKYKIVGILPRRYKYPILAVQLFDKGYEHPFWGTKHFNFYWETEEIIDACKIRKLKQILKA